MIPHILFAHNGTFNEGTYRSECRDKVNSRFDEKKRISLRHAVVCPLVMSNTHHRVAYKMLKRPIRTTEQI